MVQWISYLGLALIIVCFIVAITNNKLRHGTLFILFSLMLIAGAFFFYKTFNIKTNPRVFKGNKYKISNCEITRFPENIDTVLYNGLIKSKPYYQFFSCKLKKEFVTDSPFRKYDYFLPTWYRKGMDGSIDTFVKYYLVINGVNYLKTEEHNFFSENIDTSIINQLNLKTEKYIYSEKNSIQSFLENYTSSQNYLSSFFETNNRNIKTIQVGIIFLNKKTGTLDTIKSNQFSLH